MTFIGCVSSVSQERLLQGFSAITAPPNVKFLLSSSGRSSTGSIRLVLA